MPKNYEKLTLKTFKKKLKEGGYASATAARRGLGRIRDWSDKDKASAARAIDKYFDGAPPAKKTTKKKKKAAAKKSTTKKKAAAKKKTAKKAATKAKSTTKKARAKKDSPLRRQQARNKKRATKASPATTTKAKSTIAETLQLSKLKVGTVGSMIEMLETCHKHGFDSSSAIKKAGHILEDDINKLHKKLGIEEVPVEVPPEQEEAAAKFAQSAGAALTGGNSAATAAPPPPSVAS